MSLSRRQLVLALSLAPGVGSKTLTRVLTRNDVLGRSVDEFMRLGREALVEEYRFAAKSAEAWVGSRRDILQEAEDIWALLDAHKVAVVSAADPEYPALLEAMDPNPPGVLYLHGNTKLLQAKTFAVLASRKLPEKAMSEIEKWTEQGVADHLTLVGGADTPAYQRASVVPLRWGAPRILVLAQNLFSALGPDLKEEPFRAARLWRYQFDERTDLAISPIPPLRSGHAFANRLRDRALAGLAQRFDFAWVEPGGNMEALARRAIQAGRAVRVNPDCPLGEVLIQAGAEPLHAVR